MNKTRRSFQQIVNADASVPPLFAREGNLHGGILQTKRGSHRRGLFVSPDRCRRPRPQQAHRGGMSRRQPPRKPRPVRRRRTKIQAPGKSLPGIRPGAALSHDIIHELVGSIPTGNRPSAHADRIGSRGHDRPLRAAYRTTLDPRFLHGRHLRRIAGHERRVVIIVSSHMQKMQLVPGLSVLPFDDGLHLYHRRERRVDVTVHGPRFPGRGLTITHETRAAFDDDANRTLEHHPGTRVGIGLGQILPPIRALSITPKKPIEEMQRSIAMPGNGKRDIVRKSTPATQPMLKLKIRIAHADGGGILHHPQIAVRRHGFRRCLGDKPADISGCGDARQYPRKNRPRSGRVERGGYENTVRMPGGYFENGSLADVTKRFPDHGSRHHLLENLVGTIGHLKDESPQPQSRKQHDDTCGQPRNTTSSQETSRLRNPSGQPPFGSDSPARW